MKPKPWFIILLLSFALLIQNTCPFGAAGKTAVASSTCKDCPLKHRIIIPQDGQKKLLSDFSSIHFPHYIFEVPKTTLSFHIEPITSEGPILANDYRDALPDELLRPPRT
jgi:hypothetical protein